MRTKTHALLGAALALSLVSVACGGSGGGNGSDLSGSIFVSGSSTVEPISGLVAELFAEQNPGVEITVEGPGTGDGFQLFCNGETDVQDASRPIEREEIDACKEKGVEYTELEVALDGISVLTAPENTEITCLNFGDLYALAGPESEGFESWSDANDLAEDVGGIAAPYPDEPLAMTAPGEESGTWDAFIELAGFEDIGIERGLSEDEAAVTRPDYQSSSNDNVIIEGIAGSPSSFGWVGFSFFEQNQEVVRAFEISAADEGGCVVPTYESISDGSYALSRSLYIYVNNQKLAENPALKAYVDFYVGEEGLTTAVRETGYVVLPDDRIEETRSTWEQASA